MKDQHLTSFTQLGLNNTLLNVLKSQGYETPTPIQTKAIPSVLEGKDLLGIAQTGTGKTAAFALPILHRLAENQRPPQRLGCRALILSPTRELASQIADSFRTYGANSQLRVAVVFGGVAARPQIKAMVRGVDILVATPGRLIDHIQQRNIELSGTEILVLDEADQMLDMGFIKPIRQILTKMPAKRQNMFFSATMPKQIGVLADEMLRNPVRVSVAPQSKTADRVAQSVIHVEPQKKNALLVELFGKPDMDRAIVFTRTKRGADKVARRLTASGFKVAAIHGNKSQGQRQQALAAFRAGRLQGLIATDIAARGIDIDQVSHVVNFELPNIPESYVHRIGRTARAGAEGIAISLCSGGDERGYLRDIERVTRQAIPSQDRRGDAGLVADERPAGHADNGGQRHGHKRKASGKPGSRRSNGKASASRNNAGGHQGSPKSKDRDAMPKSAGSKQDGAKNTRQDAKPAQSQSRHKPKRGAGGPPTGGKPGGFKQRRRRQRSSAA
jgi:ATP-dependent RNA helicase RhlE